MAKAITAYKHYLEVPTKWALRNGGKVVFYRIEGATPVATTAGPMVRAKIYHVPLEDPKFDVIALVGKVLRFRTHSKVVDPDSPELWYWDNKFWVKACDKSQVPYYRDQYYLLYEVEVAQIDELMAAVKG